MLTVSVITSYLNFFGEVDYLREALTTWTDQTQPPVEILLVDSSKPGLDKEMVKDLCKEFGVAFIDRPFNYGSSTYSTDMNQLVGIAKGEAILWLCPNWWFREHTWIERMAKRLEEYGPGHILATDNDRRANWSGQGCPPQDQFAGQPNVFSPPDHSYIDNPKLMFYKSDWIPMDTDFDPPPDNSSMGASNAHGLVYWGHQQAKRGCQILLCRDFQMEHAPRKPHYDIEIGLQQVRWSEAVLRAKGCL